MISGSGRFDEKTTSGGKRQATGGPQHETSLKGAEPAPQAYILLAGGSATNGCQAGEPPPIMCEPPPQRRLWADEATIKGLALILRDNERGVVWPRRYPDRNPQPVRGTPPYLAEFQQTRESLFFGFIRRKRAPGRDLARASAG